MTDWKVGDEAVCVDARPRRWSYSNPLRENAVYTVIRVTHDRCPHYGQAVGLVLAELSTEAPGGFFAERFRKVVKDKHEKCEDEFITLLKRSKVTA